VADFDALDVDDSAFAPRPAEQLTGPWAGSAQVFEAEFGDGRRTLGRFPRNLGRNLVGVVSRDNLKPLLLGAAASGAGALLDARTQRYFGEAPRWPALGRAGQKLGDPRNLTMLTVTLFTAGRVARDARLRAATYDVAQAFMVNAAWTGALKYGVRRERPDGSNRQSFPSGHTSNAFAWATIADHHYGHKLGLPAYAVAGLVGVSRLEKNVHHLSDVLAGATLGYVVGRTVVRGDGEAVRRGKPRFTLAPMSDASGHGVGLALSGTF
jgi:membrane-associated phospholipid phosphatase